ncbi:thiamine phosphate synthase [Crenobacter cavernae]|uniref:Thiamine-phosphate synthase n=1 Tax=Crenobacter cavernae TaxID=2290923 RepID=A0ABY0F9B4_9NEIS|nr:thiamine phosphate synthase [Crenobacter cavernae]
MRTRPSKGEPVLIYPSLSPSLDGLYAVTPDTPDSDWLMPRVSAVLAGGARIVQYRSKSHDAGLRREQATEIQALCREHRALFIVNDDVSLAERLGADGVHVGRGDTSVTEARRLLGPQAIIGATCHDRPELARQAITAGASYVAFGAVFPSATKPDVVSAPLTLFADLPPLGVPVAAIGGITVENASLAWRAGTNMLAVIAGLFYSADPATAARAILAARR